MVSPAIAPTSAPPKKRACDSCHKRKGESSSSSSSSGTSARDSISISASSTTDVSAELAAAARNSPDDAASQSQSTAPSTPGSGGGNNTSSTSFGKLHFAGYHLGGISSFNGIPFFSHEGHEWIRFRTGTRPSFPVLRAPPWQGHQDVDRVVSPLYLKVELPDRQTVEQYSAMFRTSIFRQIFPIVDHVLWAETIDMAYQPCPDPLAMSPDLVTARASVFSFLAVTSLMQGKIESGPPVDADECSIKAMHLTPLVMMTPTILGLQFAFMQSMYFLFTGRLQNAAMFHSVACRIVLMLGAHLQPDLPPAPGKTADEMDKSWRYRNHLRNLFWMCYVFDKDISLRTGQPPAIDDAYCNLTLPIGYEERLYHHDEDWPSKDTLVLPSDMRLSMIKSRTSKLLYSAEALGKTDAHLLRDIRQLDAELEAWRLSIPPKYRPTLSWSAESRIDPVVRPPRRMHIIIIHFEYHYLMATIHRATGRCLAWENGKSGDIEGVSSSLALSVEASRSTLTYLREAIDDLFGESFWMTIFYPMSAILTIFCNVLLRPLDPRSKDDMELLEAAPELIKGMRTRRLTADEIVHMKMVEDFMAELIRLSNCAVAKAREERGSIGQESIRG